MQTMQVHDSAQEGAGVHPIVSAVDHAPMSLSENVGVEETPAREESRTRTVDEKMGVGTEAENAIRGNEKDAPAPECYDNVDSKASTDAPEAFDIVAGKTSKSAAAVKEEASEEPKVGADSGIVTLGRSQAAAGVPCVASASDGANPAADVHAPDVAGGLEIPVPEEDDIAFAAEAAANAVEEADQEQERLDQSRLRCRICGQGMLEGRPILRFLPMGHALATPVVPLPGYPTVNTFDEEICLHIFCGKTASILPNVNQPEMEILTKAGLKNKHGIGPEVNAALARSRSAQIVTMQDGLSTANQSSQNSKEKQYYLVREFEAHLATIRNAHSHNQARSHLHVQNVTTNRYPASMAQPPSVNIPSLKTTAPISATVAARTAATPLIPLPGVNAVVPPPTSPSVSGAGLPPVVHPCTSVPDTMPRHSLKTHNAIGVPNYGIPGAVTTGPLYLPPQSELLTSARTAPAQTQPRPVSYAYPVMPPSTTMLGATPGAAGPLPSSPMTQAGANGAGSISMFSSKCTDRGSSSKVKNTNASKHGGKTLPVRASAGRKTTKPIPSAKIPP